MGDGLGEGGRAGAEGVPAGRSGEGRGGVSAAVGFTGDADEAAPAGAQAVSVSAADSTASLRASRATG